MGALDVYAGAGDSLPSDLAMLVGLGIVFAVLIGLVHMLAHVLPRPRTWPVVAGAVAFWPLLLSGRPWAAFGACMFGLISHAVLSGLQERKVRSDPNVTSTDQRPLNGS